MNEVVKENLIKSNDSVGRMHRSLVQIGNYPTSRDLLATACRVIHAVEETSPSFAVLMIGLDHFKSLNETLGHAVADEVFELGGQRLQSALGEHDSILRLPDNEFAIVLHSVPSAHDPSILADRLAELLQRAYLVRGQVVNISASIGIALALRMAHIPQYCSNTLAWRSSVLDRLVRERFSFLNLPLKIGSLRVGLSLSISAKLCSCINLRCIISPKLTSLSST